jgi:hypothetical protein
MMSLSRSGGNVILVSDPPPDLNPIGDIVHCHFVHG